MTQQSPNILFIIADQLVPMLTEAYGHPVVKTPHLKKLADNGVRFDAAYTPCPVCGPARASLMTGKYMSTIGAWDNGALLSSDEPTFAHYLTNAEYDTVLAGKMHFVGADQLHGFRIRLNTNIYPADFAWTPVRGAEHQSERSHALHYVAEGIHVNRPSEYLNFDEEAHLRAKQYLEAKALDRDKHGSTSPFFLCASYHHPHEPFYPPQHYWDMYEDAEIDVPDFLDNLDETYSTLDKWLNVYHGISKAKKLRDPESIRRVRRAYYALVTYIDDKIGELLNTLSSCGFADNTIIVFCSDHGDMLCERGMVQKRTFYEWSSRIPLIIRFPEQQSGKIIKTPVNLIDLLPTFLDLATVEERLSYDGTSLLPLMQDETPEHRITFSEYHSQGAHTPCFMIRDGNYKYVLIHNYEAQLFDLAADPDEWVNLAGNPDYADIEAALKQAILKQFNPEQIDASIQTNLAQRKLIHEAMQCNQTTWDHEPRFDPKKSLVEQYLP